MIKPIFIVAVLLSTITIYGQKTSINIDQAILLALNSNRQIEIAKMEVEKADAAVSEAFGYALPSLDISGGYTHFIQKPQTAFPDFGAMLNNSTYSVLFDEGIIPRDNNKFLPMDFKLQTFSLTNNFQTQATVSQILFNSAVFTGIGASKIYKNYAIENLKSTIAQTILETKKAFYGVLLTKDLYEIANARFNNANAHLKNIKALREQGLVSEFSQMQVEVQVENIKPQLIKLENANIDAENGLKILLNIPQKDPIDVVGEMIYDGQEIPSEIELIEEAKNSNLSLKTLKTKYKLDEEYATIDKSNYWPTITAFGNYTYAGSSDKWDFTNYSSSTVGLNFSINLFQGGRTENKVEQDLIAAKQTLEQIHSLTDATEMQVKSKLNDLKRVKQQIEAMQKNISLAEKAYEIASNRYKEGLGSELEVKDADVSLSESRINYTNAVHDYLLAKAMLDNLIGRINSEYLDYVKSYIEN